MSYQHHYSQYKKKACAVKRKALEPCEKYCKILGKNVTVLTEYTDYKHPGDKGEKGTMYCENLLHCYHHNVKCKYSGLSPLYPDPFEDDIEPKIE